MKRMTDSSEAIREIGGILADGYLRLLKRRSDKTHHDKQIQRTGVRQIQDRGPCYQGKVEP